MVNIEVADLREHLHIKRSSLELSLEAIYKQVTNEVVSNMLKANELLREVNLTISDKLLALECNY